MRFVSVDRSARRLEQLFCARCAIFLKPGDAFFYEPDTDNGGHSSAEEPLELSESGREKQEVSLLPIRSALPLRGTRVTKSFLL